MNNMFIPANICYPFHISKKLAHQSSTLLQINSCHAYQGFAHLSETKDGKLKEGMKHCNRNKSQPRRG